MTHRILSLRISLIVGLAACSLLFGFAASAASTAEGTLTALVAGTVVDLGSTVGDDSGQIIGPMPGLVIASQTSGVFTGLTVATLNGFDYTPSTFASGTTIMLSAQWNVVGLSILSVVEGTLPLADAVTLMGTGTLVDVGGTYADTAIDWRLDANSDVIGQSVFRITTETAGGGGTGVEPSIPEPTSGLAFALGLLVIGRSLRQRP